MGDFSHWYGVSLRITVATETSVDSSGGRGFARFGGSSGYPVFFWNHGIWILVPQFQELPPGVGCALQSPGQIQELGASGCLWMSPMRDDDRIARVLVPGSLQMSWPPGLPPDKSWGSWKLGRGRSSVAFPVWGGWERDETDVGAGLGLSCPYQRDSNDAWPCHVRWKLQNAFSVPFNSPSLGDPSPLWRQLQPSFSSAHFLQYQGPDAISSGEM